MIINATKRIVVPFVLLLLLEKAGIAATISTNNDDLAQSKVHCVTLLPDKTEFTLSEPLPLSVQIRNEQPNPVYIYADTASRLSVEVTPVDQPPVLDAASSGRPIPRQNLMRRGNRRIYVRPVIKIDPGTAHEIPVADVLRGYRDFLAEGTYKLTPHAILVVQDVDELIEREGLSHRWWIEPKAAGSKKFCAFNSLTVKLHLPHTAVTASITIAKQDFKQDSVIPLALTVVNHHTSDVLLPVDASGIPNLEVRLHQGVTPPIAVSSLFTPKRDAALPKNELSGRRSRVVAVKGGQSLDFIIPDLPEDIRRHFQKYQGSLTLVFGGLTWLRDFDPSAITDSEDGKFWLPREGAYITESSRITPVEIEIKRPSLR